MQFIFFGWKRPSSSTNVSWHCDAVRVLLPFELTGAGSILGSFYGYRENPDINKVLYEPCPHAQGPQLAACCRTLTLRAKESARQLASERRTEMLNSRRCTSAGFLGNREGKDSRSTSTAFRGCAEAALAWQAECLVTVYSNLSLMNYAVGAKDKGAVCWPSVSRVAGRKFRLCDRSSHPEQLRSCYIVYKLHALLSAKACGESAPGRYWRPGKYNNNIHHCGRQQDCPERR